MSGKTRLASRSKRNLAGGNHRMTAANVVPNPCDRRSKERHRTTVSADHKGTYRTQWATVFSVVDNMALYGRFPRVYKSKSPTRLFRSVNGCFHLAQARTKHLRGMVGTRPPGRRCYNRDGCLYRCSERQKCPVKLTFFGFRPINRVCTTGRPGPPCQVSKIHVVTPHAATSVTATPVASTTGV
jgi:hypothetical protein